nr:hypothetical protein ORFx [Bat coronavirus]
MIFIFFLLFPFCSASQFWFSVHRVCNPTCESVRIFCPDGGLVESEKFDICLPTLPTRYEDTGRWFSFLNKSSSAGIKIRVLTSCFTNHYLSSCVGLENRCRGGVLHKQHSGDLEQTLCVIFINHGFKPGFRYYYANKVFTGQEQFVAKDTASYNNLANLEPGQGKTDEDGEDYDEHWFLRRIPDEAHS